MSTLPHIFIHLSKIGKYHEVLSECLDFINSSSIEGSCVTHICFNSCPGEFEFPTLDLLHKTSKILPANTPVLYIYPKGIHETPGEEWKSNLRRFFIKTLLDNYEYVRDAFLNDVDAVSCFYGYPPQGPHFSGNSWWANSSYLSKLPSIYSLRNDQFNIKHSDFDDYKGQSRYLCEKWLLSPVVLNGKFPKIIELARGIPEQGLFN